MPEAISARRATEKNGEGVVPSNSRAVPETGAGITIWYRRSSLRSELRDTRIIARSPTRCGIITRNPTTLLEYRLENDFTSCGIQKLMEYNPIAIVKPIDARCQTRPSASACIAEMGCFFLLLFFAR